MRLPGAERLRHSWSLQEVTMKFCDNDSIIENEDLECTIGTNAVKKFKRITLDCEEMLLIIDGNETPMRHTDATTNQPM